MTNPTTHPLRVLAFRPLLETCQSVVLFEEYPDSETTILTVAEAPYDCTFAPVEAGGTEYWMPGMRIIDTAKITTQALRKYNDVVAKLEDEFDLEIAYGLPLIASSPKSADVEIPQELGFEYFQALNDYSSEKRMNEYHRRELEAGYSEWEEWLTPTPGAAARWADWHHTPNAF